MLLCLSHGLGMATLTETEVFNLTAQASVVPERRNVKFVLPEDRLNDWHAKGKVRFSCSPVS